MDGVLVDGEPLHFAAVNELLAGEGRSLSLEEYLPYMGTKAGWTEFVRDFGLRHDSQHYARRYHDIVMRQYEEHARPLPGAVELVQSLRQRGVRLGLASSSAAPWVAACLASIGLSGAFDAVVTGSDVTNGKPHPEIYLSATGRLGADPRASLAIEDAPAGVAAAVAAGMTCWAVRTEYTRGLDLPGAEREFGSLREVDITDIVRAAA
jgi:HAD superfamily hydrolase (TIGR01509 family)